MQEKYCDILMKLSKKAARKSEIPVSALIVYNKKIISKAYNKKQKTGNPLYHAEIMAILKATKKLKDWRLDSCEMYVTLEPCHMCKEIIKETRINKVYYLLKADKNIYYKTKFEEIFNLYKKKYKELLQFFFEQLR